jgi:Spy/CpxP family protein refolding chaperone
MADKQKGTIMRKRWIALALGGMLSVGVLGGGAALSAATTAPAAVAGVGSPGPLRMLFSGQVGRLLTLRSELNLSDEQKSQIHDILKSHRVEIANALKPVVAKRQALRDLIAAPNTDEPAIRSAADDLGKSIGDAAIVGTKVRAELWKVLTPDQQDKVTAFRKDSEKATNDALDRLANP